MKKITKILTFVVLALSTLTLVACGPETTTTVAPTESATTTVVTATPTIVIPTGDLALNVGDKLDYLTGVSATGYKGEDLTSSIVISQNIPVDANGNVTTAGTYIVKYTLSIDGVQVASQVRNVVVTYVKTGDDIIANGDFESGSVDPFTKSEFENGACTLSVVSDEAGNKMLKVEITAVAFSQAAPRVEQAVSLDSSKMYEVSFKAKAEVARAVHVQLGELVDTSPWFIDIDPPERFFGLTTEMAEYSFRFKPNVSGDPDMTKISLTFEFGTSDKMIEAGGAAQTNVYLDDIVIKEVDSLGADTIAPVIASAGTTNFYVGDAVELLKLVNVSDDQDENPKLSIVEADSVLPEIVDGKFAKAGDFSIVYAAEDATGNKSTFKLEIKVTEAPVAGAELLKNNDFADTTETKDDKDVVTGFGGWLVWSDDNSMTYKVVEGAVQLTLNSASCTETWHRQFKQADVEIVEGKSYVLSITLKSSVARKVQIAIQNQGGDWGMHLNKVASIGAEYQTLTYTFTAGAITTPAFFLGLGKVDGDTPADHEVDVSAISLMELGAEKLVNNTFADGKIDPFVMWADAGQSLTGVALDGVLTLTCNATGSAANYNPQFKQADLTLDKDAEYVLTITLKSSVARTVQVLIQNNGGTWANYSNQIIALEADTEVSLTVRFTQTVTDTSVLFMVGLGKVDENEAPTVEHTLTISGLSLKQVGAEKEAPKEEAVTYGGEVNTVNANMYWKDGNDKGEFTVVKNEDGSHTVTVNKVSRWGYLINLYSGFEKVNFENFVIVLKGVKDDVITFKPDDNGTYEKSVTLTGEKQIIVLSVPVQMKKMVVFYNWEVETATGEYTIYEAYLTNLGEEVKGFVDNGDNTYTITEVATGGNSVSYNKVGAAQQWSCYKVVDLDLPTGAILGVIVKGVADKQILVKLNNDNQYQNFFTMDGTEQVFFTELNPEKITSIYIFIDPVAGESVTGSIFIQIVALNPSGEVVIDTNKYASGEEFDVNHYWKDNGDNAYTVVEDAGVFTVTALENKGEWSCITTKISGVDEQFNYLGITVCGKAGDILKIKPNEENTMEVDVTLTGENQIIFVSLPKSLVNIYIFYAPGTAGATGTFTISKAMLYYGAKFAAGDYVNNPNVSSSVVSYSVTENTINLVGSEAKGEWDWVRCGQLGVTTGLKLVINISNAGEMKKVLVKVNNAVEFFIEVTDGAATLTIPSSQLPRDIVSIYLFPNAEVAGACSMDITLEWVAE